jgi:hypothetical protein
MKQIIIPATIPYTRLLARPLRRCAGRDVPSTSDARERHERITGNIANRSGRWISPASPAAASVWVARAGGALPAILEEPSQPANPASKESHEKLEQKLH